LNAKRHCDIAISTGDEGHLKPDRVVAGIGEKDVDILHQPRKATAYPPTIMESTPCSFSNRKKPAKSAWVVIQKPSRFEPQLLNDFKPLIGRQWLPGCPVGGCLRLAIGDDERFVPRPRGVIQRIVFHHAAGIAAWRGQRSLWRCVRPL
jgi:hypothetical protein